MDCSCGQSILASMAAETAPAERSDRRPATSTSRWQMVVGTIGLVVVAWVGSNLFDVVSSGGTRPGDGPPGGHGPPASAPPTDDGDQTPPGGGAHDPSDFDHG